jgi:hypothetical protein
VGEEGMSERNFLAWVTTTPLSVTTQEIKSGGEAKMADVIEVCRYIGLGNLRMTLERGVLLTQVETTYGTDPSVQPPDACIIKDVPTPTKPTKSHACRARANRYTAEQRKSIGIYANEHGATKASRKFGCSVSTARLCRKAWR